MGQVKVVFTGDKTQLEQAYKDLILQNAKLEQAHQRLATKSQEAANTGSKGMNQFGASIASTVTQVVGLTAVISAANARMQEMVDLQKEYQKTNVGTGKEQSKILANLATADPKDVEKLFKVDIPKIAITQGIDIDKLYPAINQALSATGGNIPIATEIVNAAAGISRHSPEDLQAISGGAATMKQMLPSLSAEQSLAMQSTIGSPARINSPAQQARYIPAAIQSSMETLPTKDEAGRLQAAKEIGAAFAALGSVAVDTEGMSTRTELNDLSIELRDVFTKGLDYKVAGHTFKKKPQHDPGTFQGRIEAIQNDEELKKLFIEQTTGQEGFKIAREKLFDKNGVTWQKYKEALPQISTDTKAYDQQKKMQDSGTPQLSLANVEERQKSIDQRRRLRDVTAASINAQAREIRDKTLAETRDYTNAPFMMEGLADTLTGTGQRIREAMGYDVVADSIKRLEIQREHIAAPRTWMGDVDTLPGRGPRKTDAQLTPKELEDRAYIDEQLKELKNLAALQREIIANGKEMTEILREKERPGAEPNAARQEVGRHRE